MEKVVEGLILEWDLQFLEYSIMDVMGIIHP